MSQAKEKITDAELEVMKVLWKQHEPMTLAQMKAALSERNGDTIKTLLRRLCQKEAVAQEKREVYYYYPLVGQEELGSYRVKKLIDKLYEGSAKAMAAALVRNEQLQQKDLEELQEMFSNLWKEGE